MMQALASAPAAGQIKAAAASGENAPSSPSVAVQATLSAEDDAFLEELERATFLFFWEQSDPNTGLVKDRCNVRIAADQGTVASIAATGFGLTALCIGAQRGYVPFIEARDRAMAALKFLDRSTPNHRGFFYHWANVHT